MLEIQNRHKHTACAIVFRCCCCYLVTKLCPIICDPMGFPRQEYWGGLLFPSPGDLSDPGLEPASPALADGFFTTEPPMKPPPCVPVYQGIRRALLMEHVKGNCICLSLLLLMQLQELLLKIMAQLVKSLPARRETRAQSLGGEDPLEKEMTIHSSILAWRIPWTGESGGLSSWGCIELDMTE